MVNSSLLITLLLLIIGFGLLGFGANLLVTGAATLAKKSKISPLIIGATIIALGTSLPEMVISLTAALKQNPNIAVGNAIGSNIANITLVLGLTVTAIPLKINKSILRKELPILFLVMILVSILILDSNLNQLDGLILLTGTISLLAWTIYQSFKSKAAQEILEEEFEKEIAGKKITTKLSSTIAILQFVIGVLLLPISSHVILNNAIFIAHYFNISNLIAGLTIISLGTSLPELSTSLVAARKKAYDIVIGNIIGSNTLNLLVVLALPAIIHSIQLSRRVFLRDYAIMFFTTSLLYLFAFISNKKARNLRRLEGILLLAVYIGYITTLYFFRRTPGLYY